MIHIWFCEKSLKNLLDRLDKAPPDKTVYIEANGVHLQIRRHDELDKDHKEFIGYDDKEKV